MSAVNVIEHIDRTRYDVLLVGITEDGHWIKADSLEDVKNGAWRDGNCISPSAAGCDEEVHLLMDGDSVRRGQGGCRVPRPSRAVRRGRYHPGALELAKIPYVGCGVLSSAVSMDKLYTKIIVADLGIRQAGYEAVYREQSWRTWNRWWNGLRSISLSRVY